MREAQVTTVRRSGVPIVGLIGLTMAAGCASRDESERDLSDAERVAQLRQAATSVDGDRLEDSPSLDARQREELIALRAASEGGLTGTVHRRAGTVQRLELLVKAPEGASLTERARAFLISHGVLWQLNERTKLSVVSETIAGDCSSVVFQLVDSATGLPVWNALLTVTMTEDGFVRGVSGLLSGGAFKVASRALVDMKTATAMVAERLQSQEMPSITPEPSEAILDPFFYGDEAHAAQRAWIFAPRDREPGQLAPLMAAVGRSTATIAFAGPVIALPPPGSCPGHDPTVLPVKSVLDPLTETPTLVDLSPLGALPVDGADAVDRAYNLMSLESMARLFGTTNPRKHLQNGKAAAWVGGRTRVTFEEHVNGKRVDGAYLQVVFTPQSKAETIFARFVYRPNVHRMPNVSLATARATGDAWYLNVTCRRNAACETRVQKELLLTPPTAEEVVFSSRIYPTAAMPAESETLAWRLEYGSRRLYVNAWTPNEGNPTVLLDLPRVQDAIPHDIHNTAAGDRLEIQNQVVQPGITPHADSILVAGLLPTIDAFFLGVGRNGWDGSGGRMPIRVQLAMANAFWCPAPCTGSPEFGLYFGGAFTSGDILGHEFTHAVTSATANLDYYAEPGALNESYSDLFGNLIFPDAQAGAWLVGETRQNGTGPAIRDMLNPAAFGQPGHVGLMNDGCLLGDGCVHVWSGVPNRAAVFFSDGGVTGNPHPGVKRPTTAALYYQTLTAMMPTDRFVQQQVRTVATCRASVGQVFGGRQLVSADCDYLNASFREVGIDAQYLYGYQKFSTGLFGNRWDFEEHAGERLFNGCTVADHIIWGQDLSGDVQSDGGPGIREIFFDCWGARISSRAADNDPADRHVTWHMWSDWFETGVARAIEIIQRPANITRDEDCYYQLPPSPQPGPPSHFRRLFGTTRVRHWATFFDGHRGDDIINAGVMMPAGCQVVGILGIHLHGPNVEYPVTTVLDHGSHGFTMSRSATAANDLTANAHWWHDGLSSINARVVYDILEPEGTDSVPGATADTP
jgi:Thermolysin metallopeptidase, alpha-helical domain/Thermolysin metallopeptidase, catalytic domain